MQFIENRTFDEISVGDSAELTRSLNGRDDELFAVMSGEARSGGTDAADASRRFVTQGMFGGALIATVIGTELPGPGTVYVRESLNFRRSVSVGDTLTARVTVRTKHEADRRLILDCVGLDESGAVVIDGEAEVIAPAEKLRRPRRLKPHVHLHERGARLRAFVEATRPIEPIRTAIVHPCDGNSILGAMEAMEEGVIVPVLVGPQAKIRRAAEEAGRNIGGVELVDAPHSHAAADRAVALARESKVAALMKGALHTDELMGAVVDKEKGLRTERRMSHVFAFDVPHYRKPLFITDAAINIAPDLETKRDIVQNAIDLARALGIVTPKVAILSAVETVNPKLASTIEAAALCKMAERGQIFGGLLDGPLAFDNAVSREAARAKDISSLVAGDADILVVPDLEAGNMLAKQLTYLVGADAAGIVLGARVPIMLTSRADGAIARLASCAVAQLYVHNYRKPAP